MELIFALLFTLLGNANEANNQSVEQLLENAVQFRNSVVAEDTVTYPMDENIGTDEWIKRDPQPEGIPAVKGVYSTAYTANGGDKFDTILKLIDETELNSIVVDIKDDYGYVTYKAENPEIEKYGNTKPFIKDVSELMNTLEAHDVYPIARIVIFKDSVLAKQRPDLSFVNSNGTVWVNGRGDSFVNPYVKEVWEYNVEVAKEAAKLGFKEIQFDYVRFPEGFEKRADILTYEQQADISRTDIVADFVKYAREQLNPLGVRVSVDIFGYAASVPAAEGIGQDFNKISQYVDVISPMVYPSHYSTGWFGSTVPDAAPYTTIYGSMMDTHKKLEAIQENKPIIRPWIQDFTASWVPGYITYGKKEVEEQIRALIDTGIDEFLLWNAGNRFTPDVNYDLQ
ncbi:putative glycoside hydrolase [Chengkuizengella axinellae]|uniref:Glycoside hydrolase n=1 Tax=Chengkuizengella axinellae TaxID=3064388 RepID=A0ABT9IYV6_9BACL|nr:putative glycoside hydrolase [Chengkuizengella sp. 2205SS18-9]MDP5274538.1 putative glycoside hydrolase [Chengkuizengella sp. 2205SS18-9]